MNRQQTLALLFGLALIGGTGWFLSRLQGLQRLGEPGVIVIALANEEPGRRQIQLAQC